MASLSLLKLYFFHVYLSRCLLQLCTRRKFSETGHNVDKLQLVVSCYFFCHSLSSLILAPQTAITSQISVGKSETDLEKKAGEEHYLFDGILVRVQYTGKGEQFHRKEDLFLFEVAFLVNLFMQHSQRYTAGYSYT